MKFRPFVFEDIDAVADLVRKMWHCESPDGGPIDEKLAMLLAKIDFAHYLPPASRIEVAIDESDGSILGVTSARIEGCKPIFSDSSSIDSYVQDCISKAESMENGRKALDLQSVDFADTERFILENTKEIRTELQLFLVSEKSRGTGIGSQLFERFLKACGDNAASGSLVSGDSASACASSACASSVCDPSAGARFFLFTDSTCNWQWYQRRGLVRIAQKMSSDPKIDLGADKFIYADIYADKPV